MSLCCLLTITGVAAAGPAVHVTTPQPPPEWALLQRELLRASAAACEEFYARYFDDRGYLLCVERWGGDDGPDDAIENLDDWPHLHALGGPDVLLTLTKRAWEGHLRQYTLARTRDVPFARDGMYYKEFPVTFDWQHNGEGLSVFNLLGLSDPADPAFERRVRRFAGFYLGEDPGAPNYDPKHRVIRSLFNGSRGPLLRKATALDWAGDPIEVENRFQLGHGERNYQEMLDHFKDYTDIVGDHPLNLLSTTLALNAYALTGEAKYRRWLLEYVDAWRERMAANKGVIPSNVGLDGTVGGAAGGKWYGGTYGWGFTVTVPQTGGPAHRNRAYWGFVGFMNAYLLTGDDRYLDAWRKQADVINAAGRQEGGKLVTPRMHGDRGWYAFEEGPYRLNMLELYYLSMRPDDRRRVGPDPWLEYLEGRRPDYPVQSLRQALDRVRQRVRAMRADPTTPDTRLADDPHRFNPAAVTALIQQTQGGLHLTRRGAAHFCRLRYFDPARRRAGLPEDVAALVDSLTDDGAAVTLVNVSPVAPRTVVVQAGAYAEHAFLRVEHDRESAALAGPHFTVRLDPGCGARLRLAMRRHVNRPTTAFPWEH